MAGDGYRAARSRTIPQLRRAWSWLCAVSARMCAPPDPVRRRSAMSVKPRWTSWARCDASGRDGFEVCRQLRCGGNVPVIMLTARGDDFDVVRAGGRRRRLCG
jgi:hypothetical protein